MSIAIDFFHTNATDHRNTAVYIHTVMVEMCMSIQGVFGN